ncbi:venom allergen 5-like [Tubulanus polymorphus]|uniref:venom allergen 5-like n=1 Tax=Tubulanus polymorphus TaxID=672921 RepID=UPI003DA68720
MSVLTITVLLLGVCCLGSRVSGYMTDTKRQELLDEHNRLRAELHRYGLPWASNMKALEWDDRAEYSAFLWAKRCIYRHDTDSQRRFKPYSQVGQNYFILPPDYKGTLKGLVKAWFDEYKDYDSASNTCTSGKECGHYLQVVWANTQYVGCYDQEVCSKDKKRFIVCNYVSRGYLKNVKPYKTGRWCSACPAGYGFCLDGRLCVRREVCDTTDGTCKCSLRASSCKNGGVFDPYDCVCKCSEGWYGRVCEKECKDRYYGYCKESKHCYTGYYSDQYFCRKTCKNCRIKYDWRARNKYDIVTNGY